MRCEGYYKYGSFMTFGPRRWEQCENEAIVMIRFIDQQNNNNYEGEGQERTLPACAKCWQQCITDHMEILEVTPILPDTPGSF